MIPFTSTKPATPTTPTVRAVRVGESCRSNSDSIAGEGPSAPGASAAPDGALLYERHCAACHGDQGRGDGWNAARLDRGPVALADGDLMARRPDDTLFDAIHGGGYVLDRSRRMPAFGESLTAEEIRALVARIRELCGCEGPPWSRPSRGR